MTVYVSIRNNDDRLTQAEWHLYVSDARSILRMFAVRFHGSWFSLPDDPEQDACWCVEFESADRQRLAKVELVRLLVRFRQDSITWAEAPMTESLTGS